MGDHKPPIAPSIVVHALRPQIAVYASSDVDDLARANGLANLAQLLKPWETSVERGSAADRIHMQSTLSENSTLPSHLANLGVRVA
jgi:hypothetical protein